MSRPKFIKNWKDVQLKDNATYPGSDELLSQGSPLGLLTGLKQFGVHHELIKPGRRTSWPHAESTEEEWAFLIEGYLQVWVNGTIYDLDPGDFVAFPAGTGICHTFINNSNQEARLLVGGTATVEGSDNKIKYPLHPERNKEIGDRHWVDHPPQEMGPHDGLPDERRERERGTSG